MKQVDVAVIGAGVIGCAIARELSRYKADIIVVDKAGDVCEGTSKANSAIIHAGFDAAEGSVKALMNVRGNQMMDRISKELDIPFKRIGALVVSVDESGSDTLKELLGRGIENGVEQLRILKRSELTEIEPSISDEVEQALYAPTSGIVCPFEMTLGYAQNAYKNGVEFLLGCEIVNMERVEGGFILEAQNGQTIKASAVVNAAGVYSDEIHNMICEKKIKITPRRGEYFLLDRECGSHTEHTIFQLPSALGKGVLVTPTVDGNLLIGPTAEDVCDKEGTQTTAGGLEQLRIKSSISVKNLPLGKVITSFSGLRARLDDGIEDFILGETAPFFFEAAGADSPGLSSAPAIGESIAGDIAQRLELNKREDFDPIRNSVPKLRHMSSGERREAIDENPAYGAIVCRCEEISEGEILGAITSPLGAKSLDGIKRRVRAGAGRCQAGFCSPRIMELLSEAMDVPITEIKKNGGCSNIVAKPLRKEKGENE